MTTFYLRVDALDRAHGDDQRFSWKGQSPQDLAQAIERSLREDTLIRLWRDAQEDPDAVDTGVLATDDAATVSAEDKAQHLQIVVSTRLAHRLLAQRLNLLIGTHWTLGDVK